MPSANLKHRAYEHIRQRIASGAIAVGDRISELQLAKEIGISRTPVREAVNLLASQGIVELLPGYGAYIPLPGAHELRDLFGLREALECYAVAEACEHITRAQLAELERCCERQLDGIRRFKAAGRRTLDETTESHIGEADLTFHRIVLDAGGNRAVLKNVSDLRLMSRVLGRRVDTAEPNLLAVFVLVWRCHRRVLAAIRRGDAAAASHWMRFHIRETRDRYLRHLATAPSPDVPWHAGLNRTMRRLEQFDPQPAARPLLKNAAPSTAPDSSLPLSPRERAG